MAPNSWTPTAYPNARRSDHHDIYPSEKQGTLRVHDPYRWLESPSEETDQWIDSQVALTSKFLDQNVNKDKLEKLLTQNNDFEKFSSPSFKKDGRWYWSYNSGLEAQSVIYRSKSEQLPVSTSEKNGEIFFDPNLLSSDGTAALSTMAFSRDGKYFAYGISLSGSDFSTIYVRPTSNPLSRKPLEKTFNDQDFSNGNANGNAHRQAHNGSRHIVDKSSSGANLQHPDEIANKINGVPLSNPIDHDKGKLSDIIRFVKFSSITWTHDSKGFLYQRYPERPDHGSDMDDNAGTETTQDLDAKLYYHRIGTSQADDVLIVEDSENREYMFGGEVTELDGRYLILTVSRDTAPKNKLWISDLAQHELGQGIKWNKLVDTFDASYDYIANNDSKFYFLTNKDAPQYRVVSIDLADEQPSFQEVIPEDKNAHLSEIIAVATDKFAVVYKRNVKDELYIYSWEGKQLERLAEEFVGSIYISAKRDQPWFFATLSGFTTAGTIYKYDFNAGEGQKRWSLYRTTEVKGLASDDFEAEQVWYSSKDGTRVPMFIVRHKDTKFDGTAPAIQYGYGGFSIAISPVFSSSMLTVMKAYGFIFAVPNIRGGSEFGEDWHLAGTRERKVNVFDDFIAATNFLVDNKYAAPGKVAINGGSNGGLLVAACVNRAPEGTFGAAVAEVGVLDMLRFSQFTIGKAWTSDYGDPQDPHDFDFIYPISPLHNVPRGQMLPPTLLMTADHDDRVVPLHSFKYGATLQHVAPTNPHPLLLRIDRKAGHGAGKSTEKRIKDAAAKWGFVAQTLGLAWRDE